MAEQYKSGIPLFLSGAPITSLSDRNRLVFRTSEEEGMWGGGLHVWGNESNS